MERIMPIWAWIGLGIGLAVILYFVIRNAAKKAMVDIQIAEIKDNSDTRPSFVENDLYPLVEEFKDAFTSWSLFLVSSDKETVSQKLLYLSNSELALVNNLFNKTYQADVEMTFRQLIEDANGGWSMSSDTKTDLLGRLSNIGINT